MKTSVLERGNGWEQQVSFDIKIVIDEQWHGQPRAQICINMWRLPSDAWEQRNWEEFIKNVLKCILWVIKIILKKLLIDVFWFFFFYTSVWMLTSLYRVLFCTLTFTYSSFCFVFFFSLLMNFRKVCTCPCGRYVKKNKCWWHALQNVTKKNICAFCIKLFGLCLIVFIATIATTILS